MPILIDGPTGHFAADLVPFASEAELEKVVASQASLLAGPDDHALAHVAGQLDLPEAGCLDLLFVTEAGLPIAVEVKLARNGESRRQIVAQIVDYLSALTSLTVDELDALVEGHLETALRSFGADSEAFERRWQAVGANLRAGLARIILVLDKLPEDLERIVRFLSEHTNLDIRVVVITKFYHSTIGTVFVPNIAIVASGEPSPRPGAGPSPILEELGAVVAAYDRLALPHLRSRGGAARYRQIRPDDWADGCKVHYEFQQVHGTIGVELHLENPKAAQLASALRVFAGSPIGPQLIPLEWEPTWSSGRGRLRVRLELTEDPEVAARSMVDLITLTHSAVASAAKGLGN